MEESCSTSLTNESDIYQEVLELYGGGEAPTHDDQLLCSAAEAIHTHFRETKSPTSSPLDYLNRIVHTFTTTDRDLDVQLPLLSFVLPRIPDHSSIDKDVAAKAAEMVVRGLQGRVHSVMALRLFECLKMLLERCEFENWNQAQPGFQTFIKYSTDSRINVRTCAQEYVVKVFKSFQSLPLKVGAGKSVLESLTSTAADGVSKNLEFHMLDVFKSLIPCLPSEVIAEAIAKLQNSMSDSKLSSRMKRRVMKVMEAILGFIESLCERTYRKKVVIAKEWEGGYSSVIGSLADLLTAEEAIAARASYILREKIHIVSMFEYRGQTEVESRTDPEGLKMLNSLCHVFDKILLNEPNAHSLLVITTLFLKLGSCSKKYLDNILLKLATFITTASGDAKQHLERCIGIAICSMGSEAVLKLIPISLDDYDQSSKNTWLIPLLKDYTINSSLESFIVTILPLAESFRQACGKVKKRPTLREEMECNARGCWGLLPSFCRYPQDMSKMFDSLANLLFPYINGENEAQYILENIAIALQYLVKQNKKISFLVDDEASKLPCSDYYRKREAPKNIEALSLWSERFLEAFVKVFLQASPRMRDFLMETIRCLALITESSAVELIFISSFKLDEPGDNIERNRNLMLELASSFAKPTSTDLIYSFIKKYLQEEGYSKKEAYATVLSILEDSHELLSSIFAQLVDLLLDLKPHVNKTSYGWWISCLRILLLQSFKITSDGENKYATRVLNEIIDLKERSTLVKISSTLRETSSSSNTGSYSDFIIMVMQGLCESSPCRISGAVWSLSVLMSIDPKVCYLRPGLVPTVLALLHTQRHSQVIEATLELMNVLVSCLKVRDLLNNLSDILLSILPWSSVPQHIYSVRCLLHEMGSKCGFEPLTSVVPEKYYDFVADAFRGGASDQVTKSIFLTHPTRELVQEEEEEEDEEEEEEEEVEEEEEEEELEEEEEKELEVEEEKKEKGGGRFRPWL